jgi:hypothetical protein
VAERARAELADHPPRRRPRTVRRGSRGGAQCLAGGVRAGVCRLRRGGGRRRPLGAARHRPSGTPGGAQGRVDGLDPAARTAAEAVLRSPDAADPAARRAAADQARVELARADARRQAATTATALARGSSPASPPRRAR